MQQNKLRNSQQLQQLLTMNSQPHPESQPQSQNHENNASSGNYDITRLQLNSQQAAYLNKLLPACYSFQLDSKPIKRGSSTTKIPKENTKMTESRKKAPKEEAKVPVAKSNPNRVPKTNSNRFNEEMENAVYEKYNMQKEYRRNSFENVSESLRPCIRFMNLLKNSRTSWPFREPVDPVALGIPHYTEIIKEPMDLSTIENNLRTNQYVTPTQFHADVMKIINNSYSFNNMNPEFIKITSEFENYYRKITAEPGTEIPRTYSQTDNGLDNYYSKSAALEVKKSRKEGKEEYPMSSGQSITMTQKKELGINIKKLPKEDMKGIVDIVKEGTGNVSGQFDLKQLDQITLRKLQLYVKDKLAGDNKIKPPGLQKHNNSNEQESSFEVSEEQSL